MSGSDGSGGSTGRVGGSASGSAAESVEQTEERLGSEWRGIFSTRRLFIALSEAGWRPALESVTRELVAAAREIASPECRPRDVLLELVAERLASLAETNAPLVSANKERKAEELEPLLLHPWLGAIHEVGLYPFERIELATTTYERWVEAEHMIGPRAACEIIRREFPGPPAELVIVMKIPGYLVGRSKTPADKNPRHWPNKTPGLTPWPGVPRPFMGFW